MSDTAREEPQVTVGAIPALEVGAQCCRWDRRQRRAGARRQHLILGKTRCNAPTNPLAWRVKSPVCIWRPALRCRADPQIARASLQAANAPLCPGARWRHLRSKVGKPAGARVPFRIHTSGQKGFHDRQQTPPVFAYGLNKRLAMTLRPPRLAPERKHLAANEPAQ
jgi:hypothetical protein